MSKKMTVEEAFKELGRQEKRFAADNGGRGSLLAKSARDYYRTIVSCRKQLAEDADRVAASKLKLAALTSEVEKKEALSRKLHAEIVALKSRIVTHRKVIRKGDMLAKKELVAQTRFVEKVQVLRTMTAD